MGTSRSVLRLQSHLKVPLGRTHHQAQSHRWQDPVPHGLLAWAPQLLADCWLEAALSCSPCGLLHRQLTTWQLASLRAGEQDTIPQTKSHPQPFCNLILEVTHHFLCLVLLAESKSLDPALSRGGTAQGPEAQEAELQGALWALPASDTQAYMAGAKVHILSAPLWINFT